MVSNSPQKKKFLFISRAAPYGNNRAQLCLDAAFASAVFEQDVSYLFMDDGVYQLLSGQNAENIHSKSLGNMLETLDLYGIEKVYVHQDSLAQRKLSSKDLFLEAKGIASKDIATLISQSDCVINL
ncbi:MAG: sulfurtransferase complex subunit TusC [Pseudomonadales bacterium]|nr:sulfurtransferase complex subunit TusC [Pseudomonadales bacterium]